MEEHSFIDSRLVDDFHDIEVGVMFANPADPKQLPAILADLQASIKADFITELDELGLVGLSSVHITATFLHVCFRFLSLPPNDYDYELHQRVHFFLYVFACIDRIWTLGNTPFLDDFRIWRLEFAEYYDLI